MQIWRNDHIEDVDEKEFHNALVTTIDNAIRAEGLQSEVVECAPPKIHRAIWRENKNDRVQFLIDDVKPTNDGCYLINWKTLYPHAALKPGETRQESGATLCCFNAESTGFRSLFHDMKPSLG